MADDTVTIKVAGALKGVVFIKSYDATAGELRVEVARLLGLSEPSTVKMIAGGRNLQDDSKSLKDYNISATSRVLVTKGAAAHAALAGAEARMTEEEARAAKLERLKAAADKMAARGDGRGLTDRYEFSLENQAGSAVSLSESDRRGVVLGLALHEKGRASMEAGDLQAALGELLLAEESFSVVSPSVLEGIDNLAMLLLDIVWCCYKLRDISRLGVCSERLAAARRMLAQAHGTHQERLRLLHGGFSPEQAIYVRLELLEGVVAYHSGEAGSAKQHLLAAQARWQRLQLSPGALLQLAEMGYSQLEATRALRFSGGDLGAAVDFLTEQRAKEKERRVQRKRQREWLREREQYGKTAGGKYIDEQCLAQLGLLGYDKTLAAEALRQAENDVQSALDVLGDPVKRGALQLGLIAQQMLVEQQGPQDVKASHVRRLVAMGFKEKAARLALKAAGNSMEGALEQLQVMGDEARELAAAAAEAAAGGDAAAASGASGEAAAAAADANKSGPSPQHAAADQAGTSAAAAAAAAIQVDQQAGRSSDDDEAAEDVDRDMEDELINAVRAKGKDDPLAAYDMDVSEDGQAIQLYMSLLASASNTASSQGQ